MDTRERILINTFKKLREEMDDHLQSINENTSEIQANFEYLHKLEAKLDKLNEKLEELITTTVQREQQEAKAQHIKEVKLTIREQEVFLTIYTSCDFLSYDDIAKKLGLTSSLVRDYITNLIEKGIPLIKRYLNRQPEVQLEPWFKELQAKENILEISSRVAREHTI
ncbi:MAG: winged helix-turn-helix transcriptional regulator [Candidatus Woesearchaeota archaeon]